jgi:chemotaxis regulatin CheY-phosphate phosphatase CheZ
MDTGRKNSQSCSVSELIDMARALSEGEFEKQFECDFQGQLGQLASYMESLRQNLSVLSPGMKGSAHLMPEASQAVAELSKQAEIGVNSIMDLVDQMSADQDRVLVLAENLEQGKPLDATELRNMAKKNQQNLMSLLSYLSFQDVLRQRAEKVQENIDVVEKKILELLVKFKVKVNEQAIRKDGREVLRDEVKGLSEGIGLDQSMVDDLLDKLQ